MFSTGSVLSVGDEEFGSADAMVDKGGASYRFRWDDRGLGWSDGNEVSVNLVQSNQNTPALGAPTISGTVQVEEVLTADTSGIADADGLTKVAYRYQWVRNDGTTDTDIENATDAAYMITGEDVGKTIKIRVTFTDDWGNEEMLTRAEGGNRPWSATLTVGTRGGYTGYSFWAWANPELGSLSATEIEWDGKTYYVRYIFLQDSNLHLGLNNEMFSTGFVLSVGDEEFGSADAMVDHIGASYRFRWDDRGLGWSDGSEVSVNLVQSNQNTPALGATTISGTPQAGETLTADTPGITDADGLDSVSYTYQWIANDETTDTDIEDATDATYRLTDDDIGKTIKARVTFTDDRGNEETLTSAATAAEVLPALTVSLTVAAPIAHDGTNAFTFEIEFSEEVRLSDITLRDHSFVVSEGAVTKARQLDEPSNIRWQISVEPDSNEVVTVVLPVTQDCDVQGAICTGDGRKLSNRLEFIVNPTKYVAQDWPLTPTGLSSGDRFRLMILTTTTRDATSGDIAEYNNFVQDAAAGGHEDIRAHSAHFRVLANTEDVDARDNTGTTGTGVPIYWLGGKKVADDYEDFYDNTSDSGPVRHESGNLVPTGDRYAATGSRDDGTEDTLLGLGASLSLGSSLAVTVATIHDQIADPNNVQNPLGRSYRAPAELFHFHALSPVFVVE